MSAWAKVGAKCVCVDDSKTDRLGIERVITKNAVYEIEWVGMWQSILSVRLVGVTRDLFVAQGAADHPFRLSRFRPLITQSDDVRLIKSLLLEDAGLVPAGVELVP
jgi:hypothetical protein